MLNFEEKYEKEVIPKLKQVLGIKHDLAIPKIEKVVINIGIGRIVNRNPQTAKQHMETINQIMMLITGQKPVTTKAKKSIAGFKLREGTPSGFKITLRGKRMHDFIDRWINIVIPRTRDFRGIDQQNIDKDGNLNFGVKEYIVFPEAAAREDKIELFGFEITVVPRVKSREHAIELYKAMGFPLKGFA